MDQLEWLEHVTEDITSNARAREVRRELNAHISAIVDDLVRQGWPLAEAETEAINRMGNAGDLTDALASACQPTLSSREARRVVLGGIMAAAGVASTLIVITPNSVAGSHAVDAALILPFLVGAYLIGSGLLRVEARKHPFASLRRALRTHGVVGVSWAALGLVVGLQPLALHAAATGSPFSLPWYVWRDVAAPLLGVAALLTLPSLVARSVRHAVGTVGAALGAFTVAATALAFTTWHLWPVAPPLGTGPNPRWEWWTYAFPWYTLNGGQLRGKTFRWLPNPALTHLAHTAAELALFMALATVIARGMVRVLVPAAGKAGRYVWRTITGKEAL